MCKVFVLTYQLHLNRLSTEQNTSHCFYSTQSLTRAAFHFFYFFARIRLSSPVGGLESSKGDFDVLIFTQRWPITACIQWMDARPDNVCILPSQKDIWTIHGIWPTKYGSMGPENCNSTEKFDINTLKPLLNQLTQFWLNVEKGTTNFKIRFEKIT